jgi:hypothetical protein
MSDFSYQPPDGSKFLLVLRKIFEREGRKDISNILNHCSKIEITTDGQFTRRRWNEFGAFASFKTDFDTIDQVTEIQKKTILAKCNSIMPADCGLCVLDLEFVPSFEMSGDGQTAESAIEEIGKFKENNPGILNYLLDDEMVAKGKDQSNIYHLLFIVENSLRRFIELVLQPKLGKQYFDKISISKEILSGVKSRKQDESKNKWIRVRGDSDIYYLDFNDLSFIIMNNWQHFKEYFPDQAWIRVKIDELYKCRCLIAHNSTIGEHEINVIRTNYKSILLQLSTTYRPEEAPF